VPEETASPPPAESAHTPDDHQTATPAPASEESGTAGDKQPDTADHIPPPQQADLVEDPAATGDNNQPPQPVDVVVDEVDKPNPTPAPQGDTTVVQATDSQQPEVSPAKPADADSVEPPAPAAVDAAPVDEAAKAATADVTAGMSKSVVTARSADSTEPVGDFLRKSGRVVIAEASGSSADASAKQDSADVAAPFSLKSKGSKIDQKEEARKQAHARRRGHVRAASMSESVKSLVVGARVEASPSIDKIKRDGSSASSPSLSTSSPTSSSSSSSSLASSSSGSKGGGESVTKQPLKEKKEKEKKKSKWDKVRGLKGSAARDKSDTVSEDVIAAAKRERETGSSIVGMTATSTSTKKASDSLRPHLMKHNSEKLDRMLVRRPSYKVLVEQGYIKEWGDAADLAGAATAGKSPSPRGLKRSPTFKLADEGDGDGAPGGKDCQQAQGEDSDEETPRKSLIDNVQLLPTDSLWHVERGSKRVRTTNDTTHELALIGKMDIIRTLCRARTWPSRTITSSCPTTRSSSTNEVHVESSCGACIPPTHCVRACVVCCVLYVRRIVVCAEHENYWARHERLGPILISIEGKSTRGSARLLRRGTPFRFRFRFRFSFRFVLFSLRTPSTDPLTETHAPGLAESPTPSPVLSRENSPSSLGNIPLDTTDAAASNSGSSNLTKQAKRRSAILLYAFPIKPPFL
jgi:hypothetical protein